MCHRCRRGPSCHEGHQRQDPNCLLHGCTSQSKRDIQEFIKQRQIEQAVHKALESSQTAGPPKIPDYAWWFGASPFTSGRREDTGLLRHEQSVYRGEAKAIQFAAMHLPAGADVTSDCKGAVARSRRGSQVKGRNLDIFGVAPRRAWICTGFHPT